MSNIYTDPPQSRNEAIIKSTIDGTQYTDSPQSRMEDLLLDLKEVIEGGGGGGTTVVANPEGEATDELEKIQVGSDIYGIPKDYAELDNKPQINGETLSGNKTASELGLQAELDGAQTVEGNPITVTDAEPMNAESVVVELEPKQNLHGYDAPWVGGAGKNKFEVTATTQTINGITFTVNSDGTVIANGTATAEADFLMSVSNIQGSYIVNGCPIGGSASTYYLGVETTVSSWNNRDFGNGVTINDDTIIRVAIVIIGGYTANNLLFKPMIRLSTETDPTFAPYSNICPITGYSEVNVERVGKNKLSLNELGFSTTSSFSVDTDNSCHFIAPLADYYSINRVSIKSIIQSGVDYTISAQQIDSGVKIAIEKNNTAILTLENEALSDSLNVEYIEADSLELVIFNNLQISQDVYVDGLQIELGSTATTYEPYQGNTYTIDLDGTKYGGTLDVTEGGYSDEWGTHTLDYVGLEDGLFTASAPNNVKGDVFAQAKCNRMKTWASVGDLDDNYGIAYSNNTFYMKLPPECGTTASEVDDWLGENPVRVAYLKKTPSSVSTTPADITLLENTNNISTDGTNITLKYQPNNVIGECKAYTDEKIEKHNPLNYSTDEKAVGTWIDGKTIYQKTINASGLQLRDVETPIHLGDDVENVIRVFGRWKRSDNTYGVIPQSHSNNAFCIGMCDFNPSTKNMNIVIGDMNDSFYLTEYNITIQYTKV